MKWDRPGLCHKIILNHDTIAMWLYRVTLLAFTVSVVLLLAVETQWKKLTINVLDQPERQWRKTANATLNRRN